MLYHVVIVKSVYNGITLADSCFAFIGLGNMYKIHFIFGVGEDFSTTGKEH